LRLWHSRFKLDLHEADAFVYLFTHGQGRGLRIKSPHGAGIAGKLQHIYAYPNHILADTNNK